MSNREVSAAEREAFENEISKNAELRQSIEARSVKGDGKPSLLPSTEPFTANDLSGGLSYLYSYWATTSAGNNVCGQAAIATLCDYHGVDLYGIPRDVPDATDGKKHWDNDKVIQAIAKDYGPNIPVVGGTNGDQVQKALTHYGLKAALSYSGVGNIGWGDIWNQLVRWVSSGFPVAVTLDTGFIAGPGWNVHWVVVYRIDNGQVYFSNWDKMSSTSVDNFQHAWHCRFLPWPNNHCAVFAPRQ